MGAEPVIISRDEARKSELTRFFSGLPCKNGHLSERNTKGGYCIACNVKSVGKYQEKTGYSLPPEYYAEWRSKNKEKTREHDKRRGKPWLAERSARRRASAPKFLTHEHKKKMREIYAHAQDCSVVTGERYEVDHVIPINGKTVSGLHVPWNLQVVHSYINRKKQNKFEGIAE